MKSETVKTIVIALFVLAFFLFFLELGYSEHIERTYQEGYLNGTSIFNQTVYDQGYKEGVVNVAQDQTVNGLFYYAYLQGNDTLVDYTDIQTACGGI